VESVYIILQQIYSGNYLPNFIRMAIEDITKTFWSLFFRTQCICLLINTHVNINIHEAVTARWLIWYKVCKQKIEIKQLKKHLQSTR